MIRNVQALRGIAALLVLWHHLRFALNGLLPSYQLPPILATSLGAMGVDIFFIISGFVISLSASAKHRGPLDFFAARVARVVPLYLSTTLVLVLAKMLLVKEGFSAQSIWNGIFYLPIFDLGDYQFPPNLLGWTLSFEMWFYVLFAIFLNFAPARRVAFLLPVFFCAGAALMTFYHGVWYFPSFTFSPFVLEFSFGCLLFTFKDHLRGSSAWILFLAGLACWCLVSSPATQLGWYNMQRGEIIWQRVALWGAPCALVVSGLVGLELNHRFILPKILVWFGKISFSFYIIQRITISVVVAIGGHVHGITPAEVIALTVLLNIIFGYGCWRLIEKPLTTQTQNLFRNLLARRSIRQAAV